MNFMNFTNFSLIKPHLVDVFIKLSRWRDRFQDLIQALRLSEDAFQTTKDR